MKRITKMVAEVAVVTGGGGGMGRCVSTDLALRGVKVVVTGRTQSTLDETVAAVHGVGGHAIALAGDSSDETHVEKLFALTESTYGPCSVLIHAAATHGTPMPLVDVSVTEWNHVMNTNLFSTFLNTRAALRQMLPAERGSIVLVSSAGVLRGFPLAAPYAATKSALLGFARTLAAEVSPKGIRVNVLTPGAMTTTAIFASAMPGIAKEMGFNEDEMIPLLEDMSAMRRAATVEEMGRSALFLALDATAMTGQNLIADCGLTT
jgi:NAD(P)-dependent dehydrogenase (short-subunit alcohol dehydrogenase family)